MSPRGRSSISSRLMRMNLLVSGSALLLAYVSFLFYDFYTLRQNLIDTLNTEAAIVGQNSVSALAFDDADVARQTLGALRGSPHVRSAVILRPDGRLFAQYDRDPALHLEIHPQLGSDESSGYWPQGRDILLGRKVALGDSWVGSVYLLAETSDLAHRAQQFGLISAGILVLAFLVAILATTSIRGLLTGPLTNLAETARVVTRERDYSVRAPQPRTGDELAFLVESFNQMLDQIQQRDRALEESRTALEQRVQERTAELVSANRELEAFSYSVAHDLRGPLQHISNITFLLQQTSIAAGPDGADLLEKLNDGSRRMSALIEDLLNLSRATSTPLHRSPVNLSDMATAILHNLQVEDPSRTVHIAVARDAHVIADEGLVTVVMENLLRNAWKYTSRNQTANIEFGYLETAAETVYFVKDNGVGFNPRFADRLFRPFQRLHSQADFPGTGVGLATVQRIIARHGGRIWAVSAIDQGAQFFFTLPDENGNGHPPR